MLPPFQGVLFRCFLGGRGKALGGLEGFGFKTECRAGDNISRQCGSRCVDMYHVVVKPILGKLVLSPSHAMPFQSSRSPRTSSMQKKHQP